MLYSVKLSSAEETLLRNLLSQQLESVDSEGWSVDIHTSNGTLRFLPEEAAAGDEEHQNSVVERPKIVSVAEPVLVNQPGTLARNLGAVSAISVLNVLVSFSPVVPQPEIPLPNGKKIPASMGYGWVYYHTQDRLAAIEAFGNKQAVIDLDVAVELVTEKCPSIIMYTRGYFIHVSLAGLPNEDWAQLNLFSRRTLS